MGHAQKGSSTSEKLLLLFSRKPGSPDYSYGRTESDSDDALSLLCKVFPNFLNSIRGMDILDYGCGTGRQAVALASHGARYVLGIDTNGKALGAAQALVRERNLEQQVELSGRFDARCVGRFDLVISQNSMEHYPDPASALEEMKSALKPNGRVLVTFGPPWFAPYGSHMHFFTKLPWVNLLFSERTVLNVRRHFRQDGATRYEEVESGLNKMTVARFERIVSQAGVSVRYRRYDCVKNLRFLGRIPALRGLFINHISCILAKH